MLILSAGRRAETTGSRAHAAFRAALVLGAALVLTGCPSGDKKSEGAGQSKPVRKAPLVSVASPEFRDLKERLPITGEVVALERAEVYPRLEKIRVKAIHKRVGDEVAEGKPLLSLDPTDPARAVKEAKAAKTEAEATETEAEAQAAEAKAAVAQAEVEIDDFAQQIRAQELTVAYRKEVLERTEREAKGGALAERLLVDARYEHEREIATLARLRVQERKARTALTSAQAALERARSGVSRAATQIEKAEVQLARAELDEKECEVTAPFSGRIFTRDVVRGQLVTSATKLFEMYDPTSMVIESKLPQRYLSRLQKLQEVEILPQTIGAVQLEGKLEVISPVVDRASGTVTVRIRPKDASTLRPGQFVSGSIVLAERTDRLVVPRKAIGSERERPFVFVVIEEKGKKPRVQRLWFTEGIQDGPMVEVRNPEGPALSTTSKIVLFGLDRLREGDEVRIPGAEEDEGDEDAPSPESDD